MHGSLSNTLLFRYNQVIDFMYYIHYSFKVIIRRSTQFPNKNCQPILSPCRLSEKSSKLPRFLVLSTSIYVLTFLRIGNHRDICSRPSINEYCSYSPIYADISHN